MSREGHRLLKKGMNQNYVEFERMLKVFFRWMHVIEFPSWRKKKPWMCSSSSVFLENTVEQNWIIYHRLHIFTVWVSDMPVFRATLSKSKIGSIKKGSVSQKCFPEVFKSFVFDIWNKEVSCECKCANQQMILNHTNYINQWCIILIIHWVLIIMNLSVTQFLGVW